MTAGLTNGEGVAADDRHVVDENNQSGSRTIRRVQWYRDRMAEYRMHFAEGALAGEISERQQHLGFHRLVAGFLQLLKPYLTDYERDEPEIPVGKHYWEDVKLGRFTIDPPAAVTKPSKAAVEGQIRRGAPGRATQIDPRNSVEPQQYRVEGLLDFAAADPEWQEAWAVMVDPGVSAADLRARIDDPNVTVGARQRAAEPITVRKRARVPWEIINEAATQLEQFVRDIGMDVDIEAEPYMGEGGPGI